MVKPRKPTRKKIAPKATSKKIIRRKRAAFAIPPGVREKLTILKRAKEIPRSFTTEASVIKSLKRRDNFAGAQARLGGNHFSILRESGAFSPTTAGRLSPGRRARLIDRYARERMGTESVKSSGLMYNCVLFFDLAAFVPSRHYAGVAAGATPSIGTIRGKLERSPIIGIQIFDPDPKVIARFKKAIRAARLEIPIINIEGQVV